MQDITVGFFGLGLIGGSIAKALRATKTTYKLIAYEEMNGPSKEDLNAAFKEGVLDERYTDFDACYSSCDIIFLCAPILANINVLPKLKAVIKPTCILTDVSSVKSKIHEVIHQLDLSNQFIGGHPMAGSEKTGFGNARANLLENAFYILTKTVEINSQTLTTISDLIKEIGAIPIVMTQEEHDEITATISHVPHILAAQLVNLVRVSKDSEKMKQLAAGGFRDITRIASSSPIMWQNICLTNTNFIINVLKNYINSLNDVIIALEERDADYLYSVFDEAGTYRNALPKRSHGIIEQIHEIYLDIADEPGAIATIATILATNQLSLKNIGIVHNREFQDGVLRIEFYDQQTLADAVTILKRYRYSIYER